MLIRSMDEIKEVVIMSYVHLNKFLTTFYQVWSEAIQEDAKVITSIFGKRGRWQMLMRIITICHRPLLFFLFTELDETALVHPCTPRH